jgi:transcriptional regulator with PAS, ATPase and Fis domain
VVKVDFRLVAATNKNLKALVEQGRFREDLYYRVRVHYLRVPPLRERYADIAPLVQFFIRKYKVLDNSPVQGVSQETLGMLQRYTWPGNVRELENTVREMIVTSEQSVLGVGDIPQFIRDSFREGSEVPTLEEVKISHIQNVLRMVNGNRTRAAKLLGIPRITLQRLVSKRPELGQIR